MKNSLKWLWINSDKISHWASVLAFIVAGFGGYFAYSQLLQANDHRRWQNYNDMNIRYAELYKDIPSDLASGCIPSDFTALTSESQKWVRQYFNLYSEEYWLFLNKLIPDEMWTHRIYGGVRVNLSRYPALISGYHYWKAKGAFTHPDNFQAVVEKAIIDAKSIPQQVSKTCSTVSKTSIKRGV